MDLIKKTKLLLALIVVIVVGYVVYNQLFYEPSQGPIIEQPTNGDHDNDNPNEEEAPLNDDDPFDGLLVRWIPYIDQTNHVKQVNEASQALSNPTSLYDWENKVLPVYKKKEYTFEQMTDFAQTLFVKLDGEPEDIDCSTLDQDGWRLILCEFELGYLEVVQDGSYYIILLDEQLIEIKEINLETVKSAIETSWISSMIPWQDYEYVIEMVHYDTLNREILDISIVETTDSPYKEKMTITFSSDYNSIVGISKSSKRGDILMNTPIKEITDINQDIVKNNYYSVIVNESNLNEVEILGYELLYDTTLFQNALVPTIHVITTSTMDSYVNCFDNDFEEDKIVVHPLKIIAVESDNIRFE